MQPVWDFLATHRFILWVLLALGVFVFLQGTIFYRPTLRLALWYQKWWRRFISYLPEDRSTQIAKQFNRWYRKHYRSRWVWAIGMIKAVIIIGVAIAGLVLLK